MPDPDDLFEYLLRLGDDALIEAQRLGEWSAHAHEMEEDIALSNIALDQLGAARMFLTYAGEVEAAGRDEDALAFLRNDNEFRNLQLVEINDTDFGTAIAKLLCLSTFQHLLYAALADSDDDQIAAIAGKCVKESAYHVDHAALWTVRLGGGTGESRRRMTAALEEVWPYTFELFASDDLVTRLGGTAVDPATLQPEWQDRVYGVLQSVELAVPQTNWHPIGGRDGKHTEALSYLLAEMQVLHRAHPGATW
jgi:ring-1,2-phenylacetyl-CoA epoxidase subunit PaaC